MTDELEEIKWIKWKREINLYFLYKQELCRTFISHVGAIILEKLLHQPWMEVTAYKMEHTNTTLLRHALKTMRDQYYEVYVCVLGVDKTNYVLDEVTFIYL